MMGILILVVALGQEAGDGSLETEEQPLSKTELDEMREASRQQLSEIDAFLKKLDAEEAKRAEQDEQQRAAARSPGVDWFAVCSSWLSGSWCLLSSAGSRG